MELWLSKTIKNCNEKEQATASICATESGTDFIQAVHDCLGSSTSFVIAQNCGDWAVAHLQPQLDSSVAKDLLLQLAFGPYEGMKNIHHGTHIMFEPFVFAVANGFGILPLNISYDKRGLVWSNIKFDPPDLMWVQADDLNEKWCAAHAKSNKPILSSFENVIEWFLVCDKAFLNSLKKKIKEVNLKGCDSFDAMWDICKNRVSIYPK